MIFNPAVVMIFDPAGNNKFDHAVIKDIRPSTSRFFDPAESKTSSDTLRPSEPTLQRLF
jgi:hypothetical protein